MERIMCKERIYKSDTFLSKYIKVSIAFYQSTVHSTQ